MKIYIVERNNPQCWEEPEVYFDGNKAIEDIKKEYEAQLEESGIRKDDSDNGYGAAWCEWMIDEENYCGDCLIDRDIDGDHWQWRISEHLI